MVKTRWFFIFLIVSLFVSCGDQNGLVMTPEEEYFFYSVDNGSVVAPGAEIPVSFTEVDGQADQILIRLTDSAYNEIALVELAPEELKGDGLPVSLPEDLEAGVYYLQFEAWGAGVLLSESETYFYLVTGDFSISSVETYPPKVQPGGNITARVYTVYPEDSSPWLRWSLDGEVLLEGFISQIGSTVSFPVSRDEGIYTLKCELFPLEPQKKLISTLAASTDIYVSPSGSGKALENQGDSLFSFAVQLDNNTVIPGASWDIKSAEQGISYIYPDLPGNRLGSVESFSLSLEFTPRHLMSSDQWQLISMGDSDDGFILFYNGKTRTFYAGFSRIPQVLSSLPLSLFEDRSQAAVQLIYTKSDGRNRLVWQNEEEILGETEIPFPGSPESSSDSSTVLSAWTEAGILNAMEALPEGGAGADGSALSGYDTLYTRELPVPDSILVDTSLPVSEFSSLEFLLDKSVQDIQWQILFMKDSGDTYLAVDYPISVVSGSGRPAGDGGEENVYFSIIQNRDGLYVGYEGQVKGPFSVNGSLILKIQPYDSINTGINAVKEIRIYQD